MAESLLRTKLFVPPVRPKIVPRPRLIERLDQALQLGHKLILISAPAGFGKTTLVSEWVGNLRADGGKASHIANRVAWLSLDENDQDPSRFLAYFIAALAQVEGMEDSIGRGALDMLHSPQPPPVEEILTSLINDVAAVSEGIVFILDDYHLLVSSKVDKTLAFILEHLPRHMHLVISTREDPHLPLPRLRARGQLTELRGADLRFAYAEAAEFLNRIMDLELSEEDVKALETQTEGWVAGLQMVAISMKGRKDVGNLISALTGSHRYILDYVLDEVLVQQPESVQEFLLQTAVLDRMTAPLCDAVRYGTVETPTGQNNSQATLEMLEHANLFIVPLDDERRWYRYHHLFADLLRQRLRTIHRNLVPALHHRASEWYAENGFTDEAIEHALRAEDFEWAVSLIEKQADSIWERGEHAKLLKWTSKLPAEYLSARPLITIFHAWIQLEVGETQAAKSTLEAVDRAIKQITNGASTGGSMLIGHSDIEHLKSRISVMRAMIGFREADVPAIINFSRAALAALPEDDLSWRGIAAMALGDSQYIAGNMHGAYSGLSEAIRISKKAGNVYITIYTSIKLAIILQYQGKLRQALDTCHELMAYMTSNRLERSSMSGVLHAEQAEILWDLNDIDQAFQLVSRGVELCKREVDLTNLSWAHLVLVKVLYVKRDYTAAMKEIRELEKIAAGSLVPIWIISRIAAWKARILLARGNLQAMQDWVLVRQLNTDDEVVVAREVEYIVLARFLAFRGQAKDAIDLLNRLIKNAEAGGRITRTIEMALLLALTHHAQGETDKALATLEKSLSLAESGGHVRLFVNEGPAMAYLLREALNRGVSGEYVRRLLAAFSPTDPGEEVTSMMPQVDQSGLIEPLSDRELELLQLLAIGLTNREIATRLYLSLHTVKAHTRNIYSKLGVHNRTHAVARARAMGILPPL